MYKIRLIIIGIIIFCIVKCNDVITYKEFNIPIENKLGFALRDSISNEFSYPEGNTFYILLHINKRIRKTYPEEIDTAYFKNFCFDTVWVKLL